MSRVICMSCVAAATVPLMLTAMAPTVISARSSVMTGMVVTGVVIVHGFVCLLCVHKIWSSTSKLHF